MNRQTEIRAHIHRESICSSSSTPWRVRVATKVPIIRYEPDATERYAITAERFAYVSTWDEAMAEAHRLWGQLAVQEMDEVNAARLARRNQMEPTE